MEKAGDIAKRATKAKALALAPTAQKLRLVEAATEIRLNPGTIDDALYGDVVLCQVGMPRKRTTERTFVRTNGSVSLRLEAGTLFDGREWVQQPLPSGPKPRIILANLITAAKLTNSRVIDVGRSTREFLQRVGLHSKGTEYRALRQQIAALSACSMRLGISDGIRARTIDTKPIESFEAWVMANHDQRALWPGVVELSQKYFDHIKDGAVPLDERSLAALRGSALALDLYCWLAHRLCRIKEPNGLLLRWEPIKSQFGQEYRNMRAFRQELRETLVDVLNVYPSAKVEVAKDGLRLRQSQPPIPRRLMPGISGKG